MTNQTIVTGIVLLSAPSGEYDRRVVLLTKERGKISAFAKGARRPRSALGAAVNPFAFGEFTIYEGRNSNTLVDAKIQNYFEELRTDIEGAYYGFYFLELAGYYGREGIQEGDMLKLLYQTLRALLNTRIPNRLVRVIYELKLICINGEGPQVFQCVSCGKTEGPFWFSARQGGILCPHCRADVMDLRTMDTSTLYTMQYIESSPVEKLYTFVVKEQVLEELERIMKRYLEVYIDRNFQSLTILETILEN